MLLDQGARQLEHVARDFSKLSDEELRAFERLNAELASRHQSMMDRARRELFERRKSRKLTERIKQQALFAGLVTEE